MNTDCRPSRPALQIRLTGKHPLQNEKRFRQVTPSTSRDIFRLLDLHYHLRLHQSVSQKTWMRTTILVRKASGHLRAQLLSATARAHQRAYHALNMRCLANLPPRLSIMNRRLYRRFQDASASLGKHRPHCLRYRCMSVAYRAHVPPPRTLSCLGLADQPRKSKCSLNWGISHLQTLPMSWNGEERCTSEHDQSHSDFTSNQPAARFNIWNTGHDMNFDRIAHLVKLVFNTRIVVISLIDGTEL